METSSGTDADSTTSIETSKDWGVTRDEDVVEEETDDEWSTPGMTTEGVTGARTQGESGLCRKVISCEEEE